MGKIHLLDDAVINKIAAGEVVERPASVVKELVENSIDAGASSIRIELEDGGHKRITIVDNGSGMSREDAEIALIRHSTSKIESADDLFQIKSLGFRGEALASISAVSNFSFSTMQENAKEGIRIRLSEEGESVVSSWCGDHGTTITVENIFYNVPVRAKFMKSAGTEYSHCLEYVQSISLVHPDIGFTVVHNKREQFHAPAVEACSLDAGPDVDSATPADFTSGDSSSAYFGEEVVRSRASQVYGKEVVDQLLYLTEESQYGKVEALVSPPGIEKPTGKHICSFVNKRWVKDKTVRFAVMRGFHSHLMKGKYPRAITFLTIDPSIVDVNVHPAKTEMRFQYPGEVQGLIALGIRKRIRVGDWAISTEGNSTDQTATQKYQEATPGIVSGVEPTPLSGSGQGAYSHQNMGDDHSGAPPVSPAYSQPSVGALRNSPSAQEVGHGGVSNSNSGAFHSAENEIRGAGGSRRSMMSFDGAVDVDRPAPPEGLAPFAFAGGGGSIKNGESIRNRTVFEHPVRNIFSDMSTGSTLDHTDTYKNMQGQPGATIPWVDLEYVGSFAKCYLLFEWNRDLLVVDQHAFHERIIFERLQKNRSILDQVQTLMIPEAVELSMSEVEKLRERQGEIVAMGLSFEILAETMVEVTSVPFLLAGKDLTGVMAALADEDGHGPAATGTDELSMIPLATIACHSAVRSGELLGEDELRTLIAEAEGVDFYHNCPHGRRVCRVFPRSSVAGWFDR